MSYRTGHLIVIRFRGNLRPRRRLASSKCGCFKEELTTVDDEVLKPTPQ